MIKKCLLSSFVTGVVIFSTPALSVTYTFDATLTAAGQTVGEVFDSTGFLPRLGRYHYDYPELLAALGYGYIGRPGDTLSGMLEITTVTDTNGYTYRDISCQIGSWKCRSDLRDYGTSQYNVNATNSVSYVTTFDILPDLSSGTFFYADDDEDSVTIGDTYYRLAGFEIRADLTNIRSDAPPPVPLPASLPLLATSFLAPIAIRKRKAYKGNGLRYDKSCSLG